jgi:hypothetical protein
VLKGDEQLKVFVRSALVFFGQLLFHSAANSHLGRQYQETLASLLSVKCSTRDPTFPDKLMVARRVKKVPSLCRATRKDEKRPNNGKKDKRKLNINNE